MAPAFEVQPGAGLVAAHVFPAASACYLWQAPPLLPPKILGGFASAALAEAWWGHATGQAFDPQWSDDPAMLRLAARVKPRVWCGALSPRAFLAWVPGGTGVQFLTDDQTGQMQWDRPDAVQAAAWRQGYPWSWWTPDAVGHDSGDRAPDVHWGQADPAWYLGQGPHGGTILWQWAHQGTDWRVRWIEQAQHPDHAPYEWPSLTAATQWVQAHDPARPVTGYAPEDVRQWALQTRQTVRLMATVLG